MPYNTIGANKKDYLEADYISSYQLSGIDLELICQHYLKQGVQIYVENNVLSQSQKNSLNTPQQNAFDEMLHIREGLNDGEYAGYIYTNQAGSGRGHFEAFIIGKDKIIKPVKWDVDFSRTFHLGSYLADGKASTDLFDFCGVSSIPQAGGEECGSLSVSYLKNYLQNNARQLEEYTLCIPYYPSNPTTFEINYFFFPSPDVLRYSQSELYNKYIEAMLLPHTGNFTHKNKLHSIITLVTHLRNMIDKATALGNLKIKEEAALLLSILPDFTKRWLDRYQSINTKRQQMQTSEHNAYLAYTSERMNRIARAVEQDKSNPGLSLLGEIKKLVANQIPSNQIVLFITKKMLKIKFKSRAEISYFLKNIGDEFYDDILSVFPDLMVKDTVSFREACVFLSQSQIKLLINHILKGDNFDRIILNDTFDFYSIIKWLKALRVPVSETAGFLKKQFKYDWLKSMIQIEFVSGGIKNIGSIFPNKQEFSSFLREYIDMEWVTELLPRFFINTRLSSVEALFANEENSHDFLTTHLKKEFIQQTLLATEDSYDIQFMIFNYLNQFSQAQASTILFNTVGTQVLLHLLTLSVRCLVELLNSYCTVEEINLFLTTNRDLFVKAILNENSIFYLNSKYKLQAVIHQNLDFFCPRGHVELINLFQKKFSVLLQNDPDTAVTKNDIKQTKDFLETLIELIPEMQRRDFVERIFGSENIEEIFTPQYIDKKLPIQCPEVYSSKVDEPDEQIVARRGLGLFCSNQTPPEAKTDIYDSKFSFT